MQLYLNLVLLSSLIIWPAKSFAGLNTIHSNLEEYNYRNLTDEQQEYWYKLLHAPFFSGKSRIDSDKFFLSPNGLDSPSLELTATIEAFKDETKKAGWFDYPVQCVFRERFRFLKSIGYLEGVKETPCLMFEEWKNGINGESLSLIFSSSYPNNPSSLFGHTMIRVNQKNKVNDLLDYAIAFSATPDETDIGIVYALKGIFGGYKGFFEVTKYYTKVNEYSNGESRDLIEYNLKTTPEEMERFVNHVWELYQTAYADYLFFQENCSSVLSDLLDVAYFKGDTKTLEEEINYQSRWYYLPAELVRMVENKKLVESIKYRPSLKKKFAKNLDLLSKEDYGQLKSLIDQDLAVKDVQNTKVLDSFIQYQDYYRYRKKLAILDQDKKLMRETLLHRSKLPKAEDQELTFLEDNRPEWGHHSFKNEFSFRLENQQKLIGFLYKSGYHNLMSRDLGFDPFSQFDFLTASFLYNFDAKKLFIDRATIVDLVSLHPFNFYDPQFSWKAEVLYDRLFSIGCDFCHSFKGKGQMGLSTRFDRFFSANFLLGLNGEVSKHYRDNYLLGPLVSFIFLVNINDQMKLGFFEDVKADFNSSMQNQFIESKNIKATYFLDRENELGFEYFTQSKKGKLKNEFESFQLNYGHYF